MFILMWRACTHVNDVSSLLCFSLADIFLVSLQEGHMCTNCQLLKINCPPLWSLVKSGIGEYVQYSVKLAEIKLIFATLLRLILELQTKNKKFIF